MSNKITIDRAKVAIAALRQALKQPRPASEEDMKVYKAIADNYHTSKQPAQQEPLKDLMFSTVAMQKREHQRIERIVNTLAQVKQESADVDWVSLNKAADEIVRSKPTWKRFIDGTPLANDIACWMTDFALEYAAPHPQTIDKSAAVRIATALGWEPKREWVGLTDEDIVRIASTPCAVVGSYVHTFARAAEAKLKEKNT